MKANTTLGTEYSSIVRAIAASPVAYLLYLARQFRADQGSLNAAALTYTTLFAVVPLMTVTYTILASVPTFSQVGLQLEDMIFENFLPATGIAVREHLSGFANQAKTLTGLGIGFLVVTAYLMMKTIEAAFNRIWRVERSRQGMSSFLLYWAVLSLGPLLLGLGFVLTSYIASLPFISDATAYAGQVGLLKLLPLVTSTAAFTLLYSAVPNCPVPFKHALVGGFVVAMIFEGAKQGFTFFVTQFPSYQLIYGAFAAVPLFLVWIFISWMIVLLGAELVRSLSYYQEDRTETDARKTSWLLLLLEQAWRSQQQGEKLTLRQLQQAFPKLPAANRDRYLRLLVNTRLLEITESEDWVLNRDLYQLPLATLLSQLPWKAPSTIESPVERPWVATLNLQLQGLSQITEQQLQQSVAGLFLESRREVEQAHG